MQSTFSRRKALGRFCVSAAAAAVATVGLLSGCSSMSSSAGRGTAANAYWVYFSSNSIIEVARFDTATGKISAPVVTSNVPGTNWLAADATDSFLYATAEYPDKPTRSDAAGAVAAFRIDRANGMLTLLNEQATGGGDPAHVAVDPTGRVAVVANYAGGNITVLPIDDRGELGAPTVIQHTGHSTDPTRQTKPYPHSTAFDATGKLAYVQDLGTDKVVMYDVDAAHARLTPHNPPAQDIPPGNGPRHIAFDKDFRHAYVLTEMGKNIFVFDHGSATGALTQKQQVSTLAPDFKGTQSTAAEVLLTPNGKFLYATNRDLDANDSIHGIGNIAGFSVDPATGMLTSIGWTNCGGQIPRSMAIDPSGQWILCGNQNSGSIIEFGINQQTGALTQTDVAVQLASPFCELFVPMKD